MFYQTSSYNPDNLHYNDLKLLWTDKNAYCFGKYDNEFHICQSNSHDNIVKNILGITSRFYPSFRNYRRLASYEGRFWIVSDNEIYMSFWKEPTFNELPELISYLQEYIDISKTTVYNKSGVFKSFMDYFFTNNYTPKSSVPIHLDDIENKRKLTQILCSYGMMNWGSEKQLCHSITNTEYHNLIYIE